MTQISSFQKILGIRERDKKQAQKDYQSAVESFESVASQFYLLLKKKESAEKSYQEHLESASPVTILSTHFTYLEGIKAKMKMMEKSVNNARHEMEHKQELLTSAHIEVKRFEKIIDNKKIILAHHAKNEEAKLMDELSVRQFSFKQR